jgi:hypothetical protein
MAGIAPPEAFPWEFVFLAVSVFASLLGVFMCGFPTMLVALGNAIYLGTTSRRPNMAAAVGCFVICVIGLLVGFVFSAMIYS